MATEVVSLPKMELTTAGLSGTNGRSERQKGINAAICGRPIVIMCTRLAHAAGATPSLKWTTIKPNNHMYPIMKPIEQSAACHGQGSSKFVQLTALRRLAFVRVVISCSRPQAALLTT
jgi:hypothetical protein